VNLDSDSVADIKLVNSFSQGNNRSGIFMSDDEISEWGLVGHSMGDYFYVRTTYATCFYPNKDFIGSRTGDLAFFNPYIVEGMQNSGSHFIWNIHMYYPPLFCGQWLTGATGQQMVASSKIRISAL
jgi:hypothetical protein